MWSVVITLHISIFFYDSTTTRQLKQNLELMLIGWFSNIEHPIIYIYDHMWNVKMSSFLKLQSRFRNINLHMNIHWMVLYEICVNFFFFETSKLIISICTWIFIGWSCTEFVLMFSSLKLQSWLQVLVYQTAYEYSFDVHVQNVCFCRASSNIKISCSYILFTSR